MRADGKNRPEDCLEYHLAQWHDAKTDPHPNSDNIVMKQRGNEIWWLRIAALTRTPKGFPMTLLCGDVIEMDRN